MMTAKIARSAAAGANAAANATVTRTPLEGTERVAESSDSEAGQPAAEDAATPDIAPVEPIAADAGNDAAAAESQDQPAQEEDKPKRPSCTSEKEGRSRRNGR